MLWWVGFWDQLSPGGGRLIIASDGVWDALTSERAAKVCRGEKQPEVAAKNVVKVWISRLLFVFPFLSIFLELIL